MITFLIPSYQPNATLIELVQACLAHPVRVVVVDDGGQSAYQALFQALPPEVIVLTHPVNQGKGAALKTGFAYIQTHFGDEKDVIVTLDGDGQHRVADAMALALQARQLHKTILLGVRDFSAPQVPLKSRFGNKITRFITQFLLGFPISDTQTGLRAFTCDTLDFCLSIAQNRYDYEMNVLLNAKKAEIALKEHPIATVYIDNNASSHFNPIVDSLKIYAQIAKFAMVSLLSAGVDVALFALVYALLIDQVLIRVIVATVIARLCSSLFNYTLNKTVVFQSQSNHKQALIGYYTLVAAVLLSSASLVFILDMLTPINPVVIKIVVDGLLFVASFKIQRRVIFKEKSHE